MTATRATIGPIEESEAVNMKSYVIGLTTYREIVRRPLFWTLTAVASALLVLYTVVPYYTLGEDIKMVKDQGLATIMVTGLVIALFAASVSIADEIEGKTAITLLSKPIHRRDFIIGKFGGIMSAVALQFLLLSIVFVFTLVYKVGYDARESAREIPGFWDRWPVALQVLPGIVLTYLQVMILCALSVAFSTRFPLHINITAIIAIFMLGHLAPQMVQASSQGQFEGVKFVAQFFATIMPGLEFFNVGPAIATDAMVPWVQYVLPCLAYALIYSTAALVLALLMFEDRDLA